MRIASLFSGIGGFEKGILQADPTAEFIFASEIDKCARSIYRKQFGVEPSGDITKINAADVPDHDILVGGFPCQDVSIAGKRKGLCGARSGLFYEIIRIVREKQPKLVLIENVKGILSSNRGWDFARILIEMESAGYDCEWQILNTAAFLPQRRERVFIIGYLRTTGGSRRKIFPIRKSNEPIHNEGDGNPICTGTISTRNQSGQTNWDGSTTLISNSIDANYFKGPDNHRQRTMVLCDSGKGRKTQIRDETIAPLRANTGAGHNNVLPIIAKTLTGGGHSGGNHSDMTVLKTNNRLRRLTPLEVEKLQGFPQFDNYINTYIHNNTICVDLQKSYVNVEIKNHTKQKHVGNVEKKKNLNETVKSVEKNLNTNHLPIKKHVQKNVVINCVEETVVIHNRKKSYLFANFVESQNSYLQHIKTEIFVQLLVAVNTTLENVMHLGKEVFHQNEQYLIQVKNGKLFVKLYGKEVMQPVVDAKNDSIILKKHLKYITSNRLNLENIDYYWIISFYYVIGAITGCIQTKTDQKSSLNLNLYSRFGYTFNGIDENGNIVKISDTQRYKSLGNAVSTPVIEFIFKHIMDVIT